jgi:phosphoribosylanthranilate isomerase
MGFPNRLESYNPGMFVKICGVRDVDSARTVADLRPDAIGLNFYPQSPRWLDVRMAERICRALPGDVEPIGVFVNHPVDDILEIARHCRIRTIQLHGDEAADIARSLIDSGLDVIRAFRIDGTNVGRLPDMLAEYRDVPLRAALVDARVAGAYGGSGQTAPWEELHSRWQCEWPPLILAGGLRPENVAEAIRVVRPWGVDTAGGVECSTAVKDPIKVRAFIEAARTST